MTRDGWVPDIRVGDPDGAPAMSLAWNQQMEDTNKQTCFKYVYVYVYV